MPWFGLQISVWLIIVFSTRLLWWFRRDQIWRWASCLNRLTPNDLYMGRTAPLTSKRCILYIYSTNIGTEYFKHPLYSPFFPLQNAVCFIILTCLVPVLFIFYIQVALKLKKKKSGAKGLNCMRCVAVQSAQSCVIFATELFKFLYFRSPPNTFSSNLGLRVWTMRTYRPALVV
jgi:hypothetical protein